MPTSAFLTSPEQNIFVGLGVPAQMKWNIYYLANHEYTIKFVVYDMDGDVVLEKDIGRVALSLESVEQGNSDKLSIAESEEEGIIVEF